MQTMEIIDLAASGTPARFAGKRPVLALGDFDGVHRAHAALLSEACRLASECGAMPGVYTFAENTKQLLGKENFSYLTDETEKLERFEAAGIAAVCRDDFCRVKNMSPEVFCDYLTERFSPLGVVCGENFTFGKNAAADSRTLCRYMAARDVKTTVVPHLTVDGIGVSSSVIRRLLADGDTETAAKLLGYPYFIRAEVSHGAALGRKLGFPTVNQFLYGGKVVPKFGVYACRCTVDERSYHGVVNVGVRPTVSGGEKDAPVVFETHILDFSGDVYGKTATVEFYKMLRPERKFASLDELCENVMKNIAETRAYFAAKA